MDNTLRMVITVSIGLIIGAIPLVYAIIKHRLVWLGAAACVLCGVISFFGLIDITILPTALACYLIYAIDKKQQRRQAEQNRKLYLQKRRQEQEAGREAMIGTIENRRTAGAAWPPVNQVVDPEALREYERLMQQESDEDPKI